MTEQKKSQSSVKTVIKQLKIENVEVKYSNLLEAQSAKGYENSNPKYGVTATLNKEAAADLDKILAKALDDSFAAYLADLPKAEHRKLLKGATPIDEDMDANKNATGRLLVKATRPEKLGPPLVADAEGIKIERKFLGRGSRIDIVVDVLSYKMNGTVKLTLRLLGIIVQQEVRIGGREVTLEDLGFSNPNTTSLAADLFG